MTKFSTSTRISSLPDILRMAGKLSSKLLKKHFFANTNQFNIYVLFHFLSFVRKFMSQRALNLITNVREDDLFLCLDADELPKREVRFFFFFMLCIESIEGWDVKRSELFLVQLLLSLFFFSAVFLFGRR